MITYAQRHGLYNTTIVLLKFLLAPFAVCLIVLSGQLGIRLPRAFALVDATPRTQISSDGSFYVAFYGMHLFATYKSVTVKVSVTAPRGERTLLAAREITPGKKSVFFSERFALPAEFSPGDYSMAYTVDFHGRRTYQVAKDGYAVTYRREQACDAAIEESVPVFVRQGQRSPLPKEWAPMGLRVVGPNPGVALETHNGEPWIRASHAPGPPNGQEQAEHLIRLQSTLLVTAWGNGGITAKSGPAGRETTIRYSPDVAFLKRCGPFPHLTQPGPGQRVAFAGPANAATKILLTPAGDDEPVDFTLRLFVQRNQPPRSVSRVDWDLNRVSVFTSWLFGEGEQRYFDLNRYIVDPDGRNSETNMADVRAKEIVAPPDVFTLRSVDPEARLYFTREAYARMERLRPGANLQFPIEARDEAQSNKLTLVITKDVW